MTHKDAVILYQSSLSGIFPADEATIILSMVLHVSRAQLLVNADKDVFSKQEAEVLTALEKLLENVPIQYILGEADFFGHKFRVNESVLIPRPETEELVDWIITTLRSPTGSTILDIGTGSGCIPISLKAALPQATVSAIDISPEALKIARHNALVNKTEVIFIHLDILTGELNGKYDVIVSNPPYITTDEQKDMAAHVLAHEPHLALFVPNSDPLRFYRAIARHGLTALKLGGMLFFEINQAYGQPTVKLLEQMGYRDIELKKDMQGADRFVKAALSPES